MPLHLLKLAVGIDDVDQLRRIRAARAAERGGSWVYTRNHPRRAAEVLAGGSIYWVIRGHIRVRQLVSGFRSERDDNGRRYCLIEVDDELVPTLSRAWRPFQGWRYLAARGCAARSLRQRGAAFGSHAGRVAGPGADLTPAGLVFVISTLDR